MSYQAFMKREIEKAIFIEINRDIVLDMKGSPVLKKGDYPLMPNDVVHLAEGGTEGIPVNSLINGMIYIIGCDEDFVYSDKYIEFLNSAPGIKSYVISVIEKEKDEDIKKAIVFVSALCRLEQRSEYLYNRVVILMNLYEKSSLEFLEEEIVKSLKNIVELYPNFALAHYQLGEYYINKDMDMAKIHLRQCLDDKRVSSKAYDLLDKIKSTENYDRAVELVKAGRGDEALQILIPYINDNYENPDALYYTAVALRQSEQYEQALMYLNSLQKYGERPEVYGEIGVNLASLNDYESALEYFKKSLKIMPDSVDTICNIGACYVNLGNIEEAKKAFELASRLNPKDEIAKKWLNYINKIK